MKIYELAKEMGFGTKDFMEKISQAGIKDKKTHLNKLTEEEIEIMRKKYGKKSEAESKIKPEVKKQTESRPKIQENNFVEKKTEEKKENYRSEDTKKENEERKELKKTSNMQNEYRENRNRDRNMDRVENKGNNKNYQRDNRSSREGKDFRENREGKKFQQRDGHKNSYKDRNENRDNRRHDSGHSRNSDNRNTENRDRDNRERRSFNRDGQRDNRNSESRGSDNRSFDNRDNRNFRKDRDFNRDRNQSGDRRNENRPFDRDNRERRSFNKDDQRDGRNFERDRFSKDKDSRDDKRFGNRSAKKEAPKDEISAVVTSAGEKPKSAKGNKAKFDKKKYVKGKKQKEEEKRLQELRTDFRKDDKKKKKNKKHDKVLKDEIVRLEGETIGMITIGEEIAAKELAEKLGINVSDIIKKFFMEGKMLTANAILTFEEAEEVALGYEVIVEKEEHIEVSYGEKYHLEVEDREQDMVSRAPVITIMGHVDHGKTSLLDALRHTNVIEGEAGGITQKIGAYQVNWNGQKITFIDTPGHEAFTEMRARGANITDISILIVAADDGVKPQTVEAISHAKEAGVPIIVAINKIDKPGADPVRVRTELTEYGLISPDWGGTTEFVEISAKQKINLDELLETILITAELQELKANPRKRVKAVVIESRLDPKMGALADILIQEGELQIGDIFVAGESYGRVRSMVDDRGNKIEKATLSQPVEITGFNVVPNAGDTVYGVNNDKQAKKIVEDYIREKKVNDQNKKKHISLESLSQELEDQQLKELKCIIRADTKGSVEALKESLLKLNNDKVMINIIQASAGAVTEGDVKLAEASSAVVLAFNVRPTTPAITEAEKSGVEIRTYNVIYHLTEEIEKAMTGMLDPEFKEVYLGRIEVKQVFKISNVGNIAGSIVVDGKVSRTSKIRVLRDGVIIFDGEVATLKRFKDEVKEVVVGQDCGIQIKDFNDIKERDIIESYIMEEIAR